MWQKCLFFRGTKWTMIPLISQLNCTLSLFISSNCEGTRQLFLLLAKLITSKKKISRTSTIARAVRVHALKKTFFEYEYECIAFCNTSPIGQEKVLIKETADPAPTYHSAHVAFINCARFTQGTKSGQFHSSSVVTR